VLFVVYIVNYLILLFTMKIYETVKIHQGDITREIIFVNVSQKVIIVYTSIFIILFFVYNDSEQSMLELLAIKPFTSGSGSIMIMN